MSNFIIENSEKQIEFCLQMNCLGCNLNTGSYKDCPHFESKRKAMEKERQKRKRLFKI